MLCRWCGENFRWQKWSCPATRSLREDQALLLRRRLPLVPRAASPHGGNLVAAVIDIWAHLLDTCDVLELCVSLIIRGRLTIRSGLCGCSASLTSVSLHGCLALCGVRLSCSPPWNLITVKGWLKKLSLSVKRRDFADKLFKINNLSGRRRCFTDKIHSVRQRLSGITVGPTKEGGVLRIKYIP